MSRACPSSIRSHRVTFAIDGRIREAARGVLMDFGVIFREGHCCRRYSLFTVFSVLFVFYGVSPGLSASDGFAPGFPMIAGLAAAILLPAFIGTSGFGSIRNGADRFKMVIAAFRRSRSAKLTNQTIRSPCFNLSQQETTYRITSCISA